MPAAAQAPAIDRFTLGLASGLWVGGEDTFGMASLVATARRGDLVTAAGSFGVAVTRAGGAPDRRFKEATIGVRLGPPGGFQPFLGIYAGLASAGAFEGALIGMQGGATFAVGPRLRLGLDAGLELISGAAIAGRTDLAVALRL